MLTVGRKVRNLASMATLPGVPLVPVERGGDLTYHAPGQLVGYPILLLPEGQRDLHAYLRDLEEVLIGVLAGLGLQGSRQHGWTGVWVGDRKLASIGVAVRRWITLHGFALNLDMDLSVYPQLAPCGLPGTLYSSIAAELGHPVGMGQAKQLVACELERVLGLAFH